MKAIGGLFDQITTYENVAHAAWRAAQGKRDRLEVRKFFAQAEANISRIACDLATGDFAFEPYRAFPIRDPKTRLIHAPSFRDRVVHHAIVAVAGPVFERGAIPHSYACRAGRGQHAALNQVRAWLRRGDWFLKMDVAKYYDSMPHDRLLDRLARRFREQRLLRLWAALLASYAHTPGHGLPIGALTSQYLGNFYLDAVDHAVREELHISRYCRYMDDMLLLADPQTLLHARAEVAGRLAALGLRLKHGGVMNRCTLGVPFLGFTLYPDRTRLDARGRRRLGRKLRTLDRGVMSDGVRQSRAEALFAHAAWADDLAWRQALCRRTAQRRLGDRQGDASCDARRLLGQHGQEVPLRLSQQEEASQPQQESGLPTVPLLRHGGADGPPDDAGSRALADLAGDETQGKTSLPADRCPPDGAVTKAGGEAPKAAQTAQLAHWQMTNDE